MANNDTNRYSNKQPSLREQANARMRESSGRTTSQKSSQATSQTKRSTSQQSSHIGRTSDSQRTQGSTARRTSDASGRTTSTRSTSTTQRSSSSAQRSSSTTQRSTSSAQRSSSNTQRSTGRPVQKQRPASREVIQSERNRTRTNSSSKSKAKKGGISKFWVAFGLYTVLLLVLSVLFLVYTDKSLKKFEKSQSEYYMSEYIKTFEENVASGNISTDDFTIEDIDLTFVDQDKILSDYLVTLNNVSSFTYEKDPNSYNTEAPVYNIYGDGAAIAQVQLEAVSQTKLLAILTVMDWDVESLSPICSIDVTSYTFKIPSNYVPVIDGIPVAYSYQTGNVYDVEEFVNISEYVTVPQLVEYKADNVLQNSTITVKNEEGEEVPFDRDGNTITAKSMNANATLSEERSNMSLQMIQTWEDFNTDDLSGSNHGLATAQGLFIKNSLYWNMASQWANGVDITFTSAHRFNDPKYSNVVVDNYMEYSDKCYSVHIAFTKNMVFTRRDGTFSNDFDSTVYFVYYDDTDDGTDNPQWYIADIIATTK